MPDTVGFIGLGSMSGPMARNLARGGFQLPLLLANVSQQVYQMARAAGMNKEDGTAVIKVLERLAGVQAGKGTGSA
jgi:3-hydroxyisobutyrate dehydrogenase-like beta-hydroxyacid dehydrogenase